MECILGKNGGKLVAELYAQVPAQSVSFDVFQFTAEPAFLFERRKKKKQIRRLLRLVAQKVSVFVPDGAEDVIQMRCVTEKKNAPLFI